jgi:signal transduction histidine kinase/CheY-like chemotaxis protein/HPt (histidine-containing phosphotransfer) domain-containing protein
VSSKAPSRTSHRRTSSIRWLVIVTCIVVIVDATAGVLTVVSNHTTDKARNAVTSGLDYAQNTSSLMQDVLDTETAQRGYLLTGELSYLKPATAAVASGTALLKEIKKASASDPVLRGQDAKLEKLINARVLDLEQTIEMFHKGKKTAAIALVKTNRGNRETQQLRVLTAAMIKRSNALVDQARTTSKTGQLRASRASIAAYLASAILLALMALLIRNYLVSETARQESETAQIEAERLNLAKSGFLSRVSHELRTPLNAILGFGQLLEREPLEASQQETLDQMLAGGRHLLAVVDDLLDLSRIETGEMRLSVEPVQVSDAVAEARSLLSQVATTAAVGVRQRPFDPDLYVKADRQRLMQVLLNLVSNAIKYNRRGGNVVIGAARTEEGLVRIEIADTGIGIAPELIDQLFTPFERLDAASRGIEGTGLGLAVARGLVEAMGGTLGLSSKQEVGTTAWLELPVSSVDDIALRPLESGSNTNGAALAADEFSPGDELSELDLDRPSTSVLYVEDNPSNVNLVEKIFALSSELSLSVAREGAAGIAMARELRPDLILLDLHLPDMSGEQVLSALLADPDMADTPVIIVSADASPVQAKRLRAAGAVGYLTKPFDVEQLLQAVRSRATPTVGAVPGDHDGLLDTSMVASLHSLAANPAVGPQQIGEMLITFRYDADGMLSSLHEAAAEGDLAGVAREAHRLAGGSGTVGAGRFRLVCKELEYHAKAGHEAEARGLDASLDELLDRTWEVLSVEFAEELRDVPAQIDSRPSA